MEDKIIYNGQLINRNEVIFTIENRGFRYGDGIFETIRIFDGKIPFLEAHLERLSKGLEILQLDLSSNYGMTFWLFEIKRLIRFYKQKLPQHPKNYRLRLTVFRNDGGLYTPSSLKVSYILELLPLDSAMFVWNEEGIEIDIFPDVRLSCDKLSNLKTANSLPYILAALYRKKHELGDCLLLNAYDRIAESTHSNVFFIEKDTLITPNLNEGCTAGTTRKSVIRIAQEMGLKVKTKKCKIELLNTASEIFTTNAIGGIQWVSRYKKKQYKNKKTKAIYNKLNALIEVSTIKI